jgi:hypothetical protein
VIDLDAVLGQELRDIAVGQAEPEVAPNGGVMTSEGSGTRRIQSARLGGCEGEGRSEISWRDCA